MTYFTYVIHLLRKLIIQLEKESMNFHYLLAAIYIKI